jgi:hypothetical protein
MRFLVLINSPFADSGFAAVRIRRRAAKLSRLIWETSLSFEIGNGLE